MPNTPKGNVTSRQNGFPIFKAVQIGTDAPISTTDASGNSVLTLVGATNKVEFKHDIISAAKYKLQFKVEWPTGATNKTFTLTHQGLAYYKIDYPAGSEYATISFGAGPQSNSLSLEFNSTGAKLSEISYEVQSTPTLINDNGNTLLTDYKLIGEDQGWSRTTNAEGDLVLTPTLGAVAACTLSKTVTGLIIGRTYRLQMAVPTANAPASGSLASITMAGNTSPLWVIAANDATQGRNATYFNTESPRSGSIGVSGSGVREFYLVFKATANAVTIDYLGAKTNTGMGRVLRHIKLIQEPIYDGYAEEDGYRYGFNTQQKQDDIYGPGNHTTALYWEYDTRLGRRWNLDPVINPNISRYSTFENKPLLLTDIMGDIAGEYRDQAGTLLGEDGLSDGKLYVVTDQSEAQNIINLTTNHQTVDPNKKPKSAIELPSYEERIFMADAVKRSNQPSNNNSDITKNDVFGGWHEEGGVIGYNPVSYGGFTMKKFVHSPGKPGQYFNPFSNAQYATVDPLSGNNNISLATVTIIYHVHPSGVYKEALGPPTMFDPNPSGPDKAHYSSLLKTGIYNREDRIGPIQNIMPDCFVLAPRNNIVSNYNNLGTNYTFPLNLFLTIKPK